MPSFPPGAVVLISFPFTDGTGAKRRPALVLLDSGDNDLLLARITTELCQSAYDCEVADWSRSGLKAPSWVRLHKLATLEKRLVERQLGMLTPAAWQRVTQTLETMHAIMQKPVPGTV